MERTLVWYRNDLRIDDHAPLSQACEGSHALGVVCVSPEDYSPTTLGFAKAGPFRARFRLESIAALQQAWSERGGILLIRVAPARVAVPELARAWGATRVVCHEHATREEIDEEAAVERGLERDGLSLERTWGATLYHPADVPPFEDGFPRVFTRFRKACEKGALVRPPLDPPERIPGPGDDAPTSDSLPTLASLGLDDPPRDARAFDLRGGEVAAGARVRAWAWDDDALGRYKETRNGLLGQGYSSKYSPWLAHGCLSPRRVYNDVRAYEAERGANSSTYWLIFELIWRDFFHFLALHEGDRLFYRGGILGRDYRWSQDIAAFDRWRRGETGVPFVDANQRELLHTGFMSNRGRQNAACYLAKYLKIDWRWGAAWFEHCLVDYDPCSNWGNWQYVSGVGNDPRDRVFDVVGQGERYDRQGRYIATWLPELASLPARIRHAPWREDRLDARFAVRIGETYPRPQLNPDTFWDKLKSGRSSERSHNNRRGRR